MKERKKERKKERRKRVAGHTNPFQTKVVNTYFAQFKIDKRVVGILTLMEKSLAE